MSVFQVVTASNGRIVIVGDADITHSDVYVFDFDNTQSKHDFKTYFSTYIERCAEGQALDNYKVTINVEPLNKISDGR